MVRMKKLDDMIADLLDMDIVKADNTIRWCIRIWG